MSIPRASTDPTAQELLAERRAVIMESMRETCPIAIAMLMADVERIDRDIDAAARVPSKRLGDHP